MACTHVIIIRRLLVEIIHVSVASCLCMAVCSLYAREPEACLIAKLSVLPHVVFASLRCKELLYLLLLCLCRRAHCVAVFCLRDICVEAQDISYPFIRSHVFHFLFAHFIYPVAPFIGIGAYHDIDSLASSRSESFIWIRRYDAVSPHRHIV